MPELRVASFNIRTSRGRDGANSWRRRRAACAEAIRALDADVVGLQEVRTRQLIALRRTLPQLAFTGRGRDRWGGGERACIAVAPSWEIESSGTRWLSPSPDRRGSRGWDAALPRVATVVRLRQTDDRPEGRPAARVGIVNTHFDHVGERARDRSAQLLASWLLAEADLPWIVLGDFNATPGSSPLAVLADAGWHTAVPTAAGGTEHAFTGATDRDRIDHVLIGPSVRVRASGVSHIRPGGRLPSDHWPVWADVDIP